MGGTEARVLTNKSSKRQGKNERDAGKEEALGGGGRSESAKKEEISDRVGETGRRKHFSLSHFHFHHNLEFVKTDLPEMRDAWLKEVGGGPCKSTFPLKAHSTQESICPISC